MQKIDRCRLYTNDPLGLWLKEEDLTYFEPWLSWIEYERGQHLFEQGGPILGAYLLQRGAIQITQRLLDGHQLLLQFVKNGQWINLSSLTGERWHEYNAHALMPSRVRFIAKDALSAMLKRAPHLATTVHQQIGEALRASREKLALYLRGGAQRKVAALLLELAQAYGESNRYGKHIAVPMKGAEMARLAGINPTTFSQCLIRFEDRGWIRRSGGEIWVCQEVALRGIVEC